MPARAYAASIDDSFFYVSSAEAQAQNTLSVVSRYSKHLGWAGNFTSFGVSGLTAINHRNSADAGYYQAKAIGSAIIIGLNGLNCVVPGLGKVISITAGAIDVSGGFDKIYNQFR